MNDKAIQIYLARYKKSDGTTSPGTINKTLLASERFLTFKKLPITDHAISDLVAFKEANPHDRSIEKDLTLFASNPNRNYISLAAYLCGIFHYNYARLAITFHVKNSHKTVPIAEPILRAIRNNPDLPTFLGTVMDFIAHVGERRHAAFTCPH